MGVSCGARGSLRLNQLCRRAWPGVILRVGSQMRQRWRKSRKRGSSQPLRARLSSLLSGGPRYFPLLDRLPLYVTEPSGLIVAVQYRGCPLELKNVLLLLHPSTILGGGMPSTSIMHDSWSDSSSPGKSGYPVSSSARMHPKLHISMGIPYFPPSITSGAL